MKLPVPLSAFASFLFCFSVHGHDLPDEAPNEDPSDLYISLIQPHRETLINQYQQRIDEMKEQWRVRRRRSNSGTPDSFAESLRASINKYEQELERVEKTNHIPVPLQIHKPRLYSVGVLTQDWHERFITQRKLVVSHIKDTHTFSLEIQEYNPEADTTYIPKRTFVVVGMPTKNLVLNEAVQLDHVFQIIGVENNEFYILHPVIFEDGTAFYPPRSSD